MREAITKEKLVEWQRLATAATTGPWHVEPLTGRDSHLANVLTKPGGAELLEYCPPADAEFCVAARDAVPALIEEVRLLAAAVTKARELRAEYHRCGAEGSAEVDCRCDALDAELDQAFEALDA